MADNVTLPGTGSVVATDDCGASGQVQFVKLSYSADGVATPVTATSDGLEVQLGAAIPAGNNNIGDVDVATLPALPAGTNTIGSVKAAETGNTRITKRVAVTASQTGATVWTPASGKRFVLKSLWFSCKTAGDIQFFDGTDSGNTVISPICTCGIGGGFIKEWDVRTPYRSAAINTTLKYTTSSGTTGSIVVEGWEE